MNPDRQHVICSTITLRHLPLAEALEIIAEKGFTGIDLGALPGVCDHVPYDLTRDAVTEVAEVVRRSGLTVCSVNADIGDLNAPVEGARLAEQEEHLDRLLDLCSVLSARALVLPNGRQDRTPIDTLTADVDIVAHRVAGVAQRASERGIDLWIEAPHWFRLAYDLDRTQMLVDRLPADVGLVCDVSHIVASGGTPRRFLERFAARTRHVHIRDAEPGYIHHSVGRGQVDFVDLVRALGEFDYEGRLSLELETRDITDAERPAEAARVAAYLEDLMATAPAA